MEEVIPLSLFDENLPGNTRSVFAARISELPSGEMEIRKFTSRVLSPTSRLADFVGEQSTLLFDLLDIPTQFLQSEEWYLQPEYAAVKKSVRNLSLLNDSCERVLGLATCINTHTSHAMKKGSRI